MNAGKWLILGILTMALTAGIAAWMHRYYRTDAVQQFWGRQSLGLIANAPETVALRWTDPQAAERRDATVAKGMLNVRYMLGSDFAYVWPAEERTAPVSKAWGMEFLRGPQVFRVEFNADCSQVSESATGKTIRLVPPAADSLKSFFEERFEAKPASGQ